MPQPLVTENAKHIVDKENKNLSANNKILDFYHKQPFYVQTKISSLDLGKIKEKSKFYLDHDNELSKANKSLVGNIEKEFNLDESFDNILSPYFCSLANRFLSISNNGLKTDWELTSIWINFQKKYEFNPLHHHSGDYSFVLWIQIPYDLKKELALENCMNSNSPENALFNFYFPNINREIISAPIYVDKDFEGTMILFPSHLNHGVNPFYTSDDYRISISGNIIESSHKKSFSYQ